MKSKRELLTIAFLLLATFTVFNCSVPSQPDDSEEDPLTTAWTLYHANEWAEALAEFSEVINSEPAAEAYGGVGYCYLHLHQPAAALSSFNAAIALSTWHLDSRAGRLFAQREQADADYAALSAEAATLLSLAADWVFSHEPAVNWRDLWLLRAQCEFYRGEFAASLTALQALDPTLELSQTDPTTWLPWPTFTEALFHTLTEFSLLYGDM